MTSKQRQPKQKKMRTIGRWYIGETLGKGGYSWVKKGFDKKTGKCVALKFMAKADESWAKEQSKQVVTEIESLKQIRHPNVMKLYAYNLNARYPTKKQEKIDTVLLVLEFAPGGEIFDILYYTSALEPILARTYFRQSIFGLEACHNAGVAHRDIKPQNLLLDSRFNIKLTDFGLSKVFESDADAIMKTTYVGTRGYQAPELLLDKPYDLACDIFSMGVVLFILITGYPPFEQAHYSDRWFRPLAKCDYAKFWKYHAGCAISNDAKCKDLLEKMLCYDPKQRITIAQIKKHPWFNAKYLEGKELIRALRHRHREMETKRRRDARKIKDLQVSITPTKSVGDNLKVLSWPSSQPEQVLSNAYTTCSPKEFFNLLSGAINQIFQGTTNFEPEQAKMECNITIVMKNKSEQNAKPIQNHFKFEVQLFKSSQYKPPNDDKKTNKDDDDADVADQAINSDEDAHASGNKKEEVFVVRTRRLEGDQLKFREKVQKKLVSHGYQMFTGLPDWALKMEKMEDPFDKLLAQYDDDDNKEDDNYDNIDWDNEVETN
eukprot:439032_1